MTNNHPALQNVTGKCKLNNSDVPLHIRTPKPTIWPTSNIDQDAQHQVLSFIASENAKWYSHLEKQFVSSLNKT